MAQMLNLKAQPLTRAIEAIVAAGGSTASEAAQVASSLVEANLKGHDSHGIGMIPRYVDARLEGGLTVNQHPVVKMDGGAMLAVDGGQGYGQVIGREAMDLAIERAGRHGCCLMALGNSHHLGRIGQWAEQAVAAGLVSIHFVNVLSRPTVAAWGGGDGRFGTNPCCIGIPIPGEEPFILDYATSVVAQGKMRVAHNKGEKVPPGRLIDDHGNPTNDPRYVVVEPLGALMPFGEHKGSGMAIVCELLGGALSGGGTWHGSWDGRLQVLNGMFTIVIDPARMGTGDIFASETSAFMDWLRQTPVAPGFDKFRVAGEPEREARAQRLRDGILVDEITWTQIVGAAGKVGIQAAELARIAGTA